MFCSKCGTKNRKDAKFCVECGETLNPEESPKEEVETSKKVSTPSDQGGVRKAIKADAKKRVKGSLVGATAVYLLICIVISAIFGGVSVNELDADNVNMTISYVGDILVYIVGFIFSFGILMAGFNIVKDNEVTFGEVFTKPFNKSKFLGYILLLFVILFAIGFVAGFLMVIPFLGFLIAIAFIVALVYYTPAINTFMLLLADPNTKEDISFDGAVKKALEITKGNRVEYWGVTLSFIGWILLAICTAGILFIWLLPYMEITLVNMYRKWIGEESFDTTETGLSNGTVIGLTAGGCGCGCVVVILLFASVLVAIFAAIGVDNPKVQDFLDKYSTADESTIESDFEEDFDNLFE